MLLFYHNPSSIFATRGGETCACQHLSSWEKKKEIIVMGYFYLGAELNGLSAFMSHTQMRNLRLHKQIFSLHEEDIFSLQEFSLQI